MQLSNGIRRHAVVGWAPDLRPKGLVRGDEVVEKKRAGQQPDMIAPSNLASLHFDPSNPTYTNMTDNEKQDIKRALMEGDAIDDRKADEIVERIAEKSSGGDFCCKIHFSGGGSTTQYVRDKQECDDYMDESRVVEVSYC